MEHFTPHALRRTRSTVLDQLGYDEALIGKVLSHKATGKDVSPVTRKHYIILLSQSSRVRGRQAGSRRSNALDDALREILDLPGDPGARESQTAKGRMRRSSNAPMSPSPSPREGPPVSCGAPYQTHRHYSEPIDREVMSAYQKLAQGHLVIKALESVATAGADDKGLPKLAIARADAKLLQLSMRHDGSACMTTSKAPRRSNSTSTMWFDFPAGTFPGSSWRNAQALVPHAPLHLRPKRALENYHVLFEAEWTKAPPNDPFLLRRLGKGDLWVVLAMWDLTEVEKAALAARL